jgi:hypothetical protein
MHGRSKPTPRFGVDQLDGQHLLATTPSRLHVWLDLLRVANLPTVWTDVAAAWWLSGAADMRGLGGLMVGTSFLYTAGMAFNDAFDARIDRLERPERPIPSGLVSAQTAWIVGIGGIMAGIGVSIAAGASVSLVAALATAILIYDWLHKRSPWTAGLMAMCRTFLWWLPATLPGHHFTALMLGWSAIIFAYIVGVTLLARSEGSPTEGLRRNAAKVIARSLLFAPLLGTAVFSDLLINYPTIPYMLLVVGALFRVDTASPHRIARCIGLLLATIPVIDAMAVAPSPLAWLLATGFVLCWLLQRRFAAS